MTLDSGEVIILEIGQGLWFGNRMKKLLINPNECQKFGIQICDDTTNTHRNMGIEASEDLFIPMTTEVSTSGFVTHPPTDDEFHECQNILLSDEFDWDPLKIVLKKFQWRRNTGQVQMFINT